MGWRDSGTRSIAHFPKLHSCRRSKFYSKPHQSTHLEAKLFKARKKYLVTFLLNLELSLQAQGVRNNDLHRANALANKALLTEPEHYIYIRSEVFYVSRGHGQPDYP